MGNSMHSGWSGGSTVTARTMRRWLSEEKIGVGYISPRQAYLKWKETYMEEVFNE